MRYLYRETVSSLWNIRKTRKVPCLRMWREGLHFTSSWVLSSIDLIAFEHNVAANERHFLISYIIYNFYSNSTELIHIFLPNRRSNILILLFLLVTGTSAQVQRAYTFIVSAFKLSKHYQVIISCPGSPLTVPPLSSHPLTQTFPQV